MVRQFLSGTTLFDLPLLAMAIFVAFFIAVLVRTSQRARAPEYRRMADLPLQDDVQGSKQS
jgi:cbb3-type cytochrome oxidase subunit 3